TNSYLANGSFYLAQNWPLGVNITMTDYDKKEIKTYHGWRGPKREAHVIGGDVLGIPKGSPNKRLALEFIFFMESFDIQNILVSKLGWPSIRRDAYAKVNPWQMAYFDAIKKALENGVYRPNVMWWGEFEKFLNEAVARVLFNDEDAAETLDEYHMKMSDVIDSYTPKKED
ncbi:MAG: extracellular solute-binding protein, partial [Candidatus Omnitrophica bacterium]|nr:extracellular solute-binding protein [Candidatus Omnitrophota bacterium]